MIDDILKELRVIKGAVRSDETSQVHEHAGTIDAETLAAVAAMATTHVQAITEALAAGAVQRWYLVTEKQTTFVSCGPETHLCAISPPAKNPEPTSRALQRWSR